MFAIIWCLLAYGTASALLNMRIIRSVCQGNLMKINSANLCLPARENAWLSGLMGETSSHQTTGDYVCNEAILGVCTSTNGIWFPSISEAGKKGRTFTSSAQVQKLVIRKQVQNDQMAHRALEKDKGGKTHGAKISRANKIRWHVPTEKKWATIRRSWDAIRFQRLKIFIVSGDRQLHVTSNTHTTCTN